MITFFACEAVRQQLWVISFVNEDTIKLAFFEINFNAEQRLFFEIF